MNNSGVLIKQEERSTLNILRDYTVFYYIYTSR